MQLKIPTNLVFYISIALAILSLILSLLGGIGTLGMLGTVGTVGFWAIVMSFLVLTLGILF